MRKVSLIIILTLLISACSNRVFAQKGIHIGLRITPQKTWMINGDDFKADKNIFKFAANYSVAFGLHAGYYFNNNFGITGGIWYSNQGQKNYTYYTDYESGNVVSVKQELSTSYIKVPVLFRANTNSERKLSWVLEVGPQIGFCIGASERDNDKRYKDPNTPILNVSDVSYVRNFPKRLKTLKTVDLGAVLSLGVDIKLRYNLKMNVMIRSDISLLDIENKKADYDIYQDGDKSTHKYYSNSTKPWYKDTRSATRNFTTGIGIGFTYTFIPHFHY